MDIPEGYRRILREFGRPLEEISPGSKQMALSREAALHAIELLDGTEIAILGGDGLVEEEGRLRYAYANWYSLRRDGEAHPQFARRSRQEATDYIKTYPVGSGPPPLFTLSLTGAPRVRS